MTYTITATLELYKGWYSAHRTAEAHEVLELAHLVALESAKPWHFEKPAVRILITCNDTGEILYDGVLADPWGWEAA